MASRLTMTPRRNETNERLINRFKRKIKKIALLDEVKERRYFTKKSDKKRRARQKAVARRKKQEQKDNKNTN